MLLTAWEASLFVTLTYPKLFPAPDDHGTYKRHLKQWVQRLNRRFPVAAGFWKLEFQSRDAAHYHIVLFGIPAHWLQGRRANAFQRWLSRSWAEVVAEGGAVDADHLKAGTQCKRVEKMGGMAWYLANYARKIDQTRPGNFTRRYWGRVNAKALPLGEIQKYSLSVEGGERAKVCRVMRKLFAAKVNNAAWEKELRPYNPFPRNWTRLEMEERLRSRRPRPSAISDENGKAIPFRIPRRWRPRKVSGLLRGDMIGLTVYCDASDIARRVLLWCAGS